MPRFIAFLRAINVGGHTVKMERLRTLFEELDFTNVETFIASGNVIFEASSTSAATLEKQIESHLKQELGYAVATFLRSPSELSAVATYKPFSTDELEADGNSLYIAFLPAEPKSAECDRLMAFCSEIDDFHVHEREIYWLCRTKMSDSTFSGARLEKAIGMPATMRNVTTIKKLAAKYPDAT
jgi:uncharacterized protein (DUF1697 family)